MFPQILACNLHLPLPPTYVTNIEINIWNKYGCTYSKISTKIMYINAYKKQYVVILYADVRRSR